MAEKIIGIIAGKGQFPLLFAKAAKKKGMYVVACAHKGETLPQLEKEVDEITWVRLGQLGKLIKALKKAGVEKAVMCGGVEKTRMFKDVKPDFKALTLLNKLRHMADDGILRTFCKVLEDEGITVLPSHELLPELLAQEGVFTKRLPTEEELADIEIGWSLACDLGRLDIGQCVVIHSKVAVAVEAVEGTDACVLRGGELANHQGGVVVKRCKPIQDKRFDLPSVGSQTIKTMMESKATCLVIEANATLIFDQKQMVELADNAGICLLAKPGE